MARGAPSGSREPLPGAEGEDVESEGEDWAPEGEAPEGEASESEASEGKASDCEAAGAAGLSTSAAPCALGSGSREDEAPEAPSGVEADVGQGGAESARPGTAQPALAAQGSPQGSQEQRRAEGGACPAAAEPEADEAPEADGQEAGLARYAQVRRRLKVVSRQFVIQHGRKPCLDDLRSGSTMFPDRETRARVKRLTNEYNRLRKQYATSAKGDL